MRFFALIQHTIKWLIFLCTIIRSNHVMSNVEKKFGHVILSFLFQYFLTSPILTSFFSFKMVDEYFSW
jgi:hypothetical protein